MFEIRSKKNKDQEIPAQQQPMPKVEEVIVSTQSPNTEDSILSIFGTLREIHEGDYMATIYVTEDNIQIISTSKVAKQ